MADRRAPLTDSSATKSGGRGRNMSSATGNRYLVGRMGGVRVLVRVNNRREGHADASSVGGLLPVPSAGVRTWLTQSLEHGRTAVAEREPPKLPHLRHVALEPAHVTQQRTHECAVNIRYECRIRRHYVCFEFS
jgi:hypothetical protein